MVANPVVLKNRLMRHIEASFVLLIISHGLPLFELLLLSLLPTSEEHATSTYIFVDSKAAGGQKVKSKALRGISQ